MHKSLKKKILCVIPARAGSKGVKNKNLRKVGNITLTEHTINQAQKSKFINYIAVSTDSTKIQKIAKINNIWCEKLRPKKFSGDNAKLYDAINHVLSNIKYNFDIIVELHPTYLFRDPKQIDKAIKYFLNHDSKSLISIFEIDDTSHPDYYINLKKKKIFYKNSPTKFNRHKLKKYYKSSGYILVSKVSSFYKFKNMLSKDCLGYVIKDKLQQLDINTIYDFLLVKMIYEKKLY